MLMKTTPPETKIRVWLKSVPVAMPTENMNRVKYLKVQTGPYKYSRFRE